MSPSAWTLDGKPVEPGSGVVPLMKEVGFRRLKIVGTGFYVTRYGVFLTAGHVLEDFVDRPNREVLKGYVLHVVGNGTAHLRRIRHITILEPFDLALGQADNYVEKYPDAPLLNLRVPLTLRVPVPGARLVTYAYPENKILDANVTKKLVVQAGYYEGEFSKFVQQSEHPSLPYPHIETTIDLGMRTGAGHV